MIFVSARLRRLPVRSSRLPRLCWRRPGRPWRAHGATQARHGPPSERPQSVPGRLATAFACPTGRPKAFWSAWASILARLGRSAWSPGTPFAFDFRTSWHCALRLAFARATAFDQQNAKKKTWRFRFRPAFGCSCSPAQLSRLFPRLARSRFIRCPKVNAPST